MPTPAPPPDDRDSLLCLRSWCAAGKWCGGDRGLSCAAPRACARGRPSVRVCVRTCVRSAAQHRQHTLAGPHPHPPWQRACAGATLWRTRWETACVCARVRASDAGMWECGACMIVAWPRGNNGSEVWRTIRPPVQGVREGGSGAPQHGKRPRLATSVNSSPSIIGGTPPGTRPTSRSVTAQLQCDRGVNHFSEGCCNGCDRATLSVTAP